MHKNYSNSLQTGILQKGANNGRFLIYNLKAGIVESDLRYCLTSLFMDNRFIIGLGKNALSALNMKVSDYREFPELNAAVEIPDTHGDLFVFIRDFEAGKVTLKFLEIKRALSACFQLELQVDGFKYLGKDGGQGHDLTGYEDGTENPVGDNARAAVARSDGSCFVAVQQWQHDLGLFDSMPQEHKDNTIGRRLSDNKELSDAPPNSHVNRSDQGTFEIDADIIRRSLPWSNEEGEGLMFIAFCENLDRYEVQMRRMAGLTDGIIDALFTFSKIRNSAYFYCPAVNDNKLMLQ